MPIKKSVKAREGIFFRTDAGWEVAPPLWFINAEMKQNTPELPWIRKDEGVSALLQHEVIMLFWGDSFFFDAQFSCHTKMHSHPRSARKLKEHLFPVRF